MVILYTSSHLTFTVGLESAIVGEFTLWKLAAAANQDWCFEGFLEGQLLKIYQHTSLPTLPSRSLDMLSMEC